MDIVTYALLKGNVNNLADSIAGKYDPNTEYHAGQIVVYEYELKRALGTTTGEFDPTKWEDVKITDLLGGGGGESIIIRASSHKTVDTYEVPVLTDTQLTQAYNGVVAGKNVFIVDDLDTITSQVLDASSIDGIAVRVLFTDALILTYKENGVIESVNVKWRGNVELDTTLTKSGEAAEAKAVGDALTQLNRDLSDLDARKMEYAILNFTGSAFTLDGTVLTFAEIKELCLNKKDFVYALYANRLYIPQYISNSNLFFEASYIDSDIPQMHRISINSSNQVSQFSYNLAKTTQIPTALPTPNKLTLTGAVTGEFDGSEAKTFNIPTGGGGGSEEYETLIDTTLVEDTGFVTLDINSKIKKIVVMLVISPVDINITSRALSIDIKLKNGKRLDLRPCLLNWTDNRGSIFIMDFNSGYIKGVSCVNATNLGNPYGGGTVYNYFSSVHTGSFINIYDNEVDYIEVGGANSASGAMMGAGTKIRVDVIKRG